MSNLAHVIGIGRNKGATDISVLINRISVLEGALNSLTISTSDRILPAVPFINSLNSLNYYNSGNPNMVADGVLILVESSGIYRWEATSTEDPDGNMIIQPTGVGTGRWYKTTFSMSAHNLLGGIQGGSNNDYYHLTQEQVELLIGHFSGGNPIIAGSALGHVKNGGNIVIDSNGEMSFTVPFGGSGNATTVSRSDHNHTGTYEPANANIVKLVNGKILISYIPGEAIGIVYEVASQVAQVALTAKAADVCKRTDTGNIYIRNNGTSGTMADWYLITVNSTVVSVNSRTGAVVLDKGDVGLENVLDVTQLEAAKNLFDIPNKGIARNNLGLGDAAVATIGVDVAPNIHSHEYTEIIGGFWHVSMISDLVNIPANRRRVGMMSLVLDEAPGLRKFYLRGGIADENWVEDASGVVIFATQEQVNQGSSTTTVVNPRTLKTFIDAYLATYIGTSTGRIYTQTTEINISGPIVDSSIIGANYTGSRILVGNWFSSVGKILGFKIVGTYQTTQEGTLQIKAAFGSIQIINTKEYNLAGNASGVWSVEGFLLCKNEGQYGKLIEKADFRQSEFTEDNQWNTLTDIIDPEPIDADLDQMVELTANVSITEGVLVTCTTIVLTEGF